MRVLLSVSGTYPYYRGGVSVWAHQLLRGMPDVEFRLLSIVSNPNVTPRFALAANARLLTLPLWGVGRPEEFTPPPPGGGDRWGEAGRERRAFLAAYETFLTQCAEAGPDPQALAGALVAMALFFRRYDFYTTMRSPDVWDTFRRVLGRDPLFRQMSLRAAVDLCRRIERHLRVLTVWPGPVDLVHVAIAGIAGIPAVVAKVTEGTPVLLTEHGVYYRERLLNLINEPVEPPLRTFLGHVEHALVRLNYAYADLVTAVCRFNTRWERALGVPPEKIRVIYNGVDAWRFRPGPKGGPPVPTVVSVSRVDRLKDTLNLIEAMAHVRRHVPAVRCLVYGEAPDPEYRRLCLERIEALGLADVVTLHRATDDPVAVYRAADVVVSASLSEGFPFGVIEAMACGKMVVATDVGGVREALEGCGILVPPRAPRLLGDALVTALRDPVRRQVAGARARERVLALYQLGHMVRAYRDVYRTLAAH